MLVVEPRSNFSHSDACGHGPAFLPPEPRLDGDTPLGQQVLDAATSAGRAQPEALADFLVELLDANALIEKAPWHFSRGEIQIGALLVTFARPFERVVLVDPTAGLDGRRARDLAGFLVDLGTDHDVHVYSDDSIFDG